MDVLHAIGDLWVRRRAAPSDQALTAIRGLEPATLVTGASEGLGLALASRLAREHRTIVLLARSTESVDHAGADLKARYPGARVIVAALDAGEPSAPDAIDALLSRERLYLDVLVNNAAVGLGGEFTAADPDRLDEVISTNVAAITRLTRHYLPAMRARARGGIINVASLAAFVPGPWQAAYFASKAYVVALTAAIGSECAGEGVRVCVVAPGPIETGIHRKMRTTNTFYRLLLPSISSDRMARLTWRSYRLGRRVVVPGIVSGLFAWSARAMPYELLLPLVGWLMRPRHRPIPGMRMRMRAQGAIDRTASLRDLDDDHRQAHTERGAKPADFPTTSPEPFR